MPELLQNGMYILFYVLLVIFALQSIFLAYHWFTYGSSKQISLVALSIYLAGGALLFITLSVALAMI